MPLKIRLIIHRVFYRINIENKNKATKRNESPVAFKWLNPDL